jgi:hypothetical protein
LRKKRLQEYTKQIESRGTGGKIESKKLKCCFRWSQRVSERRSFQKKKAKSGASSHAEKDSKSIDDPGGV